MKKVLTIIFMMAVMFGVSAQTYENDYTYGFWSNWSIGGAPIFSKTIENNWAFGQGTNVGLDIRAQKQVAKHWDMRIIAEVPGFFTSDTMQFDRYAKGLIGFAWTPKNHFYVFADGGLGVKRDNYNWIALAADAGIGVKWDVCKHSRIFCEAGIDVVADMVKDMSADNAFVKVGYLYRFGLTKLDKDILSQRESVLGIYNQDTIDVLNTKIEKYVSNEKCLVDKIYILETHDSSLHAELSKVCQENDSLRDLILSMSERQINYYALPFSVQFDINSYIINSSEVAKIKAVANLMKSDTTVHYTVSGFCDNTGSQAYNQKLSEKRAEVVKYALMKYGVKEEQIEVNGHGKDMPFGDAAQAINRRVSFYRNF